MDLRRYEYCYCIHHSVEWTLRTIQGWNTVSVIVLADGRAMAEMLRRRAA